MSQQQEHSLLTEHSDESTYSHVLKYTGLFGGVQVLTMLFSVIRNKITAYFLGDSGIGLMCLFNSALHLINQSTNFGLTFSAVKHVAELFESKDKTRIRAFCTTVRMWCLFVALLGTLCTLGLAPMLSKWTFGSDVHTVDFLLLSPIVGILTIVGGELAILKGLKRLKKVALISIYTSVTALIICTPIYWIWGIKGIVPALLILNFAILGINLYHSTRVIPWHWSCDFSIHFKAGIPMLLLGVGYIIAGVFGQGAEYIIRSFIFKFDGNTDGVGLYQSGYVLTVTYTSLVFAAIEADFFPRLSACGASLTHQNKIINQQIEVSLLLITPVLIPYVLTMPLVILVLFSREFLAAVPMATYATFFMFFKSLYLPVAYLPLAKGDSKMYVFTEVIYDTFIAVLVPFCYHRWGLQGAGCALALGGLEDLFVIHALYRWRYGFRLSKQVALHGILQFILFSTSVFCAVQSSLWLRWTLGSLTFALSLYLSLHILGKETEVLNKVKQRFHRHSTL